MLPSAFKTCISREEIFAGELSADLFAVKLRLVVDYTFAILYKESH
ncbi:hypothetical protein [Nostoc sp. MS1]|nr:hypothetical protein [Nostoc sp. MS1]